MAVYLCDLLYNVRQDVHLALQDGEQRDGSEDLLRVQLIPGAEPDVHAEHGQAHLRRHGYM